MSNTENHFQKHKSNVERFFDRAHVSVYTDASLQAAIAENRAAWHLSRVAITAIAELLLRESRLKLISLGSASYPSVSRYTWGLPSLFELALSLKPNSYLSHGTAAYLRGLLRDAPATFHVNKEQSPKEQLGTLTQEGLDRAFSSRPRQSNLVFADQDGHRFVVIAASPRTTSASAPSTVQPVRSSTQRRSNALLSTWRFGPSTAGAWAECSKRTARRETSFPRNA